LKNIFYGNYWEPPLSDLVQSCPGWQVDNEVICGSIAGLRLVITGTARCRVNSVLKGQSFCAALVFVADKVLKAASAALRDAVNRLAKAFFTVAVA
jgi:hypothetical protein